MWREGEDQGKAKGLGKKEGKGVVVVTYVHHSVRPESTSLPLRHRASKCSKEHGDQTWREETTQFRAQGAKKCGTGWRPNFAVFLPSEQEIARDSRWDVWDAQDEEIQVDASAHVLGIDVQAVKDHDIYEPGEEAKKIKTTRTRSRARKSRKEEINDQYGINDDSNNDNVDANEKMKMKKREKERKTKDTKIDKHCVSH